MPAVIMPKMGDGMEEGVLLRWLKGEGEAVAEGEPIAEIETDKVTIELTADNAGTLAERIKEGESIPVGKPVAMILGAGESPANGAAAAPTVSEAPADQGPDQPAGAMPASGSGEAVEPARPPEQTAPPTRTDGRAGGAGATERIKASPLARRIAQEHELDLRQIRGSGPGGRIVREDVEAFLARPKAPEAAQAAPADTAPAAAPVAEPAPAPDGARRTPLSRMRAAIGRRMVESKTTIPHFYVSAEVDMTEALAWRKRLNETAAAAGESYKISVNDMIVKACGLALVKYPNLNVSYVSAPGGDTIEHHDEINISVAVALKEGLIGPVMRGVDTKSLGTVAREANDLINRAREGKLLPNEVAGGTFTVSNLGPFGVSEFIGVITPPQAAILAVGSSAQQPAVVGGEIVIRDRMTITISADHRVTDGAEAAQFVGEVRRLLENPLALLL